MSGADAGPTQQARASGGFIALYALAQVGAFISFIPLLQILVPLRAALIDPGHAAILLSRVALWGAVVASLANILFGALSDRTSGRGGRRRPWLFAGLAGTLGAYALIWWAATPAGLFAGVIAFQFAFNAMFAPLGAVLADHVPGRQHGVVSALLGLGYPVGGLIGAAVVGAWVVNDTARYLVLGLLVGACITPLGARLRGSGAAIHSAPFSWRGLRPIDLRAHPDFALVWMGRLLVATGFSVVQGYMLFYLQRLAATNGTVPGRPEAALAHLIAITTTCNVVCALAGGWLSDRIGRRKIFVVAGGVGLATGIAGLAVAHTWAQLQAATVIYGSGAGLYYAVDLALIVQVLPSLQSAGRDLGMINLSNTLPQIVAPLLALWLLGGTAPEYRAMFMVAAGAALAGAACVVRIKGAR
jgi:MFS family permease